MNSPSNKILIYSLIYSMYNWNKKSYKLLRKTEIPGVNKMYIKNIPEAHRLAKHILLAKYNLVLGIADHNKNATQHRYENSFINKYGKSEIIKGGIEYESPTLKIPLTTNIYYANKPSNGPCNRSGYLIAKMIRENKLKTRFAFIHINKNLDDKELVDSILDWINQCNSPNSA